MAYKFQLGAARLSGSVIQEGNIEAESAQVSASILASPDFVAAGGSVTIESAASAEAGMDIKNGLQLDSVAVTATAAELNIMDGVTATTADLNILDGVTATTAELNILDGVTATAAELNLVDGAQAGVVENSKAVIYDVAGKVFANGLNVGAAVLSEADLEQIDDLTAGTVTASKAVVVDANKDIGDFRNVAATQFSASADLYAGAGIYAQSIGLASVDGIAGAGLVDDGSGLLTLSASVAGDGLAFSAGVLSLDMGEVSDGTIRVADDNFLFIDADDGSTKKESMADYAVEIAGAALSATDGVLAVEVDDSSIEVNSDALRVKASGITNQMLAGSITAEKLNKAAPLFDDAGALSVIVDDSSIEIDVTNGLQVKALGITNDMLAGSIASSKIAELNSFDTDDLSEGSNLYYTDARVHAALSVTDTDAINMTYDGSGDFSAALVLETSNALAISASGLDLKGTIAGNRTFSNNIIIQGDLTVSGTTTTINSTTVEIADVNILLASGSANASAADGAGLTIDGADVQWKYANNGIDNASASGDIWMASGSAGLVDIQAAKFYGELVGSVVEGVDVFTTGGTLKVGINKAGSYSSQLTMLLPSGASAGTVVRVKGTANTGDANREIFISRQGSDTIDGTNTAITLESAFAAVSLIKLNSTEWMVF